MAEIVAETPRLVLRTWDESDVAPFMAALNTPAVMQWLGGLGDDTLYQKLFERMQICQRDHGYCFWIVKRKSDAALLGFCGLYVTERPATPVEGMTEIGWRLREDAWGMGYAREAAEASLDLGFGALGLEQIVAFTVRENAASWGLMQRLGMVRSHDHDHILNHVSGMVDTIVYKIDKRDWTQ